MAFGRALDNLIGNALRYGKQVMVSAAAGDKSLTISVEDDGPGIAPDDRARAVRPFERLDDARNQDRGSGTGLGLAITSDIARRHGGTLRLGTSETLGGLKAEIVLPRQSNRDEDSAQTDASPDA
jgi:two-component system osmolarity sensor histidine kinase EnvZ